MLHHRLSIGDISRGADSNTGTLLEKDPSTAKPFHILTMKFGSQFQWFLQAELNEEYGSHCLRYKQLKKQLSRCRKWDPSVPLPEDSLSPWDSYRPVRAHCVFCDTHFWAEVGKEVKDINTFFRKRAVYLLQEHGVSPVYTEGQERAGCFSCFFAGYKSRQAIHVADSDSELAREARQLIEFAQVNTIALRKLMKKYDKVHRTGMSHQHSVQASRGLSKPLCPVHMLLL